MMNYIEMRERKSGAIVRVYGWANDKAIVFSPVLAERQHGNGWQHVKIGTLLPMDYSNYCGGFENNQSKTIKNKAKSRLTLVTATWRCTDGEEFDHSNIENAIEHELKLMESKND